MREIQQLVTGEAAARSNVVDLAQWRAQRHRATPPPTFVHMPDAHEDHALSGPRRSHPLSPAGLRSTASLRKHCVSLGVSTTALAGVASEAITLTRWRLGHHRTQGDGAYVAFAWACERMDATRPLPLLDDATARTRGEQHAIRWALTRLAHLVESGIDVVTATAESVTIPLVASTSRPITVEEYRTAGSRSTPRDNVVAGTVPVYSANAAEYHAQRLVARRLQTVMGDGFWHNGHLTVPIEIAHTRGWQIAPDR